MELSFGQLADALCVLHPTTGRNIVEARLKYFYRAGFPNERADVGAGTRIGYPVDDTLKLVLAFELLAAGAAPALVAATVRAGFDAVATTLYDAWAMRRGRKAPLLVYQVPGLQGESERPGRLLVTDRRHLVDWLTLQDDDSGDRRFGIVVLSRMMRALDRGLAKRAVAFDEDVALRIRAGGGIPGPASLDPPHRASRSRRAPWS